MKSNLPADDFVKELAKKMTVEQREKFKHILEPIDI